MASATPITDSIRALLGDDVPPTPRPKFGGYTPSHRDHLPLEPFYQRLSASFGTRVDYDEPLAFGNTLTLTPSRAVFGAPTSPAVFGGPSQADISGSSLLNASSLTLPSTPTPAVRPHHLQAYAQALRIEDEVPAVMERVERGDTTHIASSEYGSEINWDQAPTLEMAVERDGVDNEPVATPAVLENRQRGKEEALIRKEKALDPNGEAMVPVTEIDQRYRGIFKFDKFNRVQTAVFDAAYKSDENLVVSAPTSSGKTTIFELAFLRLLTETSGTGSKPLAIYVAPTKALCSERSRDWISKFDALKAAHQTRKDVPESQGSEQEPGPEFVEIKCVEVTGDTGAVWLGKGGRLDDADLIVTTPEKWDAVTRAGSSGRTNLERVALFMIDEVHVLRESRGPTLEVVVSRMRACGRPIRFVAVSASVPNIDDVARWLGPPPDEEHVQTGVYEGGGKDADKEKEFAYSEKTFKDMPRAKVFKFGEEYRPTKLRHETIGFDGAGSEWALNAKLDKELYPILMKQTERKPTLVFCPTRRGCQTTARTIFESYIEAKSKNHRLPWFHDTSVDKQLSLRDKAIEELAKVGIAVHHAGLEYDDRRAIEEGFKNGKLQLLVSTSTLAVGVNLPAHTVIIKGTTTWTGVGTGHREYSDIDIQQMMGRAGRPQFDNSGTVIVMCERSQVDKYRNMLNSNTLLESCLHGNLTEHLNSEIALGTITNLKSAQEWLKSSFLYVRIQQNPKHYAFAADKNKSKEKSWDAWLDHYVSEALSKLEKHKFVTHSKETEEETEAREGLAVTDSGKTMSANCISFGTMCTIQDINKTYDFEALFELLCGAVEFTDLRIRPGEAQLLNAIRGSGEMRFKLENPPKSYADKVFILLQTSFGNIDTTQYGVVKTEVSSIGLSLAAIYQSAGRIAKAILRVCSQKKLGLTTMAALELSHTVHGRAWETDATIFRQLERIGPKSLKKLDEQGVRTFDDLLQIKPFELELWLNRLPPFGKDTLQNVALLPRFRVRMEEAGISTDPNKWPKVDLKINIELIRLNTKEAKQKRKEDKRRGTWNMVSALCLRSDGEFVDFRKVALRNLNAKTTNFDVEVEMREPGQSVILYVGVDEMSGVQTREVFAPNLSAAAFPINPPISDEEEVGEESHEDQLDESTSEADPGQKSDKGKTASATNEKTKKRVTFDVTASDRDSSTRADRNTSRPEGSKKTSAIRSTSRDSKTPKALFLAADSEGEVEDHITPLHVALEKQAAASRKRKTTQIGRSKGHARNKSRSKSIFIDDEAVEGTGSDDMAMEEEVDELDEDDEIQVIPRPVQTAMPGSSKSSGSRKASNGTNRGAKRAVQDTDPATLAKKPKHRSITSASPTPEPEATTPPSPEASQSKTAPALVDFAKKSIDEMTDAELDEEFDRVWGRPNSLLFGNS